MKNQKLLKRIENFIEKGHENEKASRFIEGTFFYTQNPGFMAGDDTYWGYRYFLCYHNTRKVMVAFKTQAEIDEFLCEYGF